MRDIYFRIWIFETKKMLSPKIMEWAGQAYTPFIKSVDVNDEGKYSRVYSKDYTHVKKEPFALMQFTGLHDRNGKEIYEGDILVDTASDGNGGEIPYTKSIVIFDEGAFKLKELLDPEWGMDYMDDICHLEVIGNIYEGENK